MKENKWGFIITGFITVISAIIPLYLKPTSIALDYILAIFGGAILSFIICIINYIILRKKSFYEIILEDKLFLDFQFYLQSAIENGNSLSKKSIIDLCHFASNESHSYIIKIHELKSCLMFWEKKNKYLLKKLDNYIKDNYYTEFNDLYLFIITVDDETFISNKEKISNYFFNIVTVKINYNEILDELQKLNFKKLYKRFKDYKTDNHIQKFLSKLSTTSDKGDSNE